MKSTRTLNGDATTDATPSLSGSGLTGDTLALCTHLKKQNNPLTVGELSTRDYAVSTNG